MIKYETGFTQMHFKDNYHHLRMLMNLHNFISHPSGSLKESAEVNSLLSGLEINEDFFS